MSGSVKTQGTELFLIDTTTSSVAQIIKMACPTGVSGLGGPADQIDDTCLDATEDRSFVRGLGNPGQVSVPFVFKPTTASHQLLFDLKEQGNNLDWLIALSDGSGAPTLNSDDGFNAPADRTCLEFNAYISDVNLDIATNEVVRGTLTLQRSGPVIPHWKA
jgi:hypothetical protein